MNFTPSNVAHQQQVQPIPQQNDSQQHQPQPQPHQHQQQPQQQQPGDGITSGEIMMQPSPKPMPGMSRQVCQPYAPRNNSNEADSITLLEGMQRHTPFVAHGQKKEAWDNVAAYVRTHGGRDLQTANYILCMRRYVALKEEFNRRGAKSRMSSGLTKTMTRQDELLMDLVQKEAGGIHEQRRQREQCTDNESIPRSIDEWQGYINREEALLLMDVPVGPFVVPSSYVEHSSSASSSVSSCSNHSSSNTNRPATSASVRFNPLGRRAQRTQAPRSGTVEKKMLELMDNINELVSEIRQKISTAS